MKTMLFGMDKFDSENVNQVLGKFIEAKRPPLEIRDRLDIGFRMQGYDVEIFEIRPVWNNPSEKKESKVAKASFDHATECWTVFWQRSDLKWHKYEPSEQVDSITEFLELVDEDQHGCFWG